MWLPEGPPGNASNPPSEDNSPTPLVARTSTIRWMPKAVTRVGATRADHRTGLDDSPVSNADDAAAALGISRSEIGRMHDVGTVAFAASGKPHEVRDTFWAFALLSDIPLDIPLTGPCVQHIPFDLPLDLPLDRLGARSSRQRDGACRVRHRPLKHARGAAPRRPSRPPVEIFP